MEERINKNKIIVIVGTTSSGKTKLGVRLAAKYNGEIVSADSRQVYRGLDIGTGKDLHEYNTKKKQISYHMIDIASPKRRFSLAEYHRKANGAVEDTLKRGRLPIIVGGTGLYVQAIVDGFVLNNKKPDIKKRQKFDNKTVKELYNILAEISNNFAKKLNNSDRNNKRRLIRYIELLSYGDKKVFKKTVPKYEFLIISPKIEKDKLNKRIYKRLIDRLEKEDMVREVERLHKEGISWKRLEEFGLEYKYISWYLQEKMDYDEMVEKLFIEIKKFAKRQITWLKRWEKQGRNIIWISSDKEIEQLVNSFLYI